MHYVMYSASDVGAGPFYHERNTWFDFNLYRDYLITCGFIAYMHILCTSSEICYIELVIYLDDLGFHVYSTSLVVVLTSSGVR